MHIRSSKHQTGIRKRQAILVFLRRNPASITTDVAAGTDIDKVDCAGFLKAMFDYGEVSREPVVLRQGLGYTQSFRYTAKAEHTRGWLELLEHENPADPEPWVTRNTDPERPALPSGGGQGALRPRVWAAGTSNMVIA